MTTGAGLRATALGYHGEPYSTASGRTSPTSGIADCSGLIVKTLTPNGITPGGTVSTTIETWAVRNGGRYITADEAARTPMSCCAIWGLGSNGHIGFSWGDGRVYETPSDEGRRVGFSRFWRNRWTRFFTLPGVDHLGPGATPTRRRYTTDMVILIAPNLDKTWTAFRVIGDTITREYPLQPVGAFGIPQAAIDDAGDNIAIKQATWDEVNLLKKITAIAQVVPTGGTAPSPDQVTADEAAAVAGQSATAAVNAAAAKIGADTAKATKAGLA